MSNFMTIKKNIIFIFSWSCLCLAYFISLQNNLYLKGWDLSIYIIQLTIDILIGLLGFNVYKHRTIKNDRSFFLLIFISFIFGLITNEIYNVLINLVHISKEIFRAQYWSTTYTLFLLTQIFAWGYLLKYSCRNVTNLSKKWLTLYPFLVSSIIIILSLIIIVFIKTYTAENIEYQTIFNSLLEIVVFTLISMSLARSKNIFLIWISTGLMLLIGFNFAHRFSDSMSIYYKTFNVAWLITLIILIYGLLLANKNCNKKIEFFEEDSTHVMTSGAFIIFSNFILTIFIFVAFGLTIFQIDKIPSFTKLALDIPGALIISYSLTILFAKYLAWRLTIPLEQIINAENEQRSELEKKSALLELAARVAHDIRSPIAVMEMSLHEFNNKACENNVIMMKMAVQSIRDIANNLLEKYRATPISQVVRNDKIALLQDDQNINRPILLLSLIDQAISQKRQEWLKNPQEIFFEVTSSAKLVWINIAPVDIKRMISNLLNNAVEACNNNAKIKIELDKIENELHLIIADNGIGIKPEEIDLFLSGASSKHAGNGIGLSSAKKYVENIHGALLIHSQPNVGTSINLIFPCISQPAWFPKGIDISSDSIVIVLDDDEAILSLWLHRLREYPVKIHPFTNYMEATKWVNTHTDQLDKIIFLVDYELPEENVNGLMLLKEFAVTKKGYLITSHAEEVHVQQLAQQQNIWLIPKIISDSIPIILN